MTNAELIKALRICANQTCCDNCPRYDIDHTQDAQRCCIQLINDAADALEAADKRIAELEARMPKEGEWIIKPHGTYGRLRAFCSACGKHSGIGGIVSNQKKPYCPNCGARMRGEHDGET